jgi:hypothetical protein
MKLKCVSVMIMFGLLVVFTATGICQEKITINDWVEKVGQGSINWSAGYIEAIGIGAPPDKAVGKINARPMALRTAKADALRNLLEIAKDVRVDSKTTIRAFTVESDIINTQVNGLVQGAMVADQQYMPDGTVEVKLRMPLYGDLARTVLPATIEKRKSLAPITSVPPVSAPPKVTTPPVVSKTTPIAPPPAAAAPTVAPPPSAATPTTPPAVATPSTTAAPPVTPPAVATPATTPPVATAPAAPTPAVAPTAASPPASTPPAVAAPPAPPAPLLYTGIVVDARGIQARPAMSPRIFDEDGKEIYGPGNVDREYALKQGMSGYARDVAAAQSNQRVTANPLNVKALKTSGAGKADLVISNVDAKQIRDAETNAEFLKQCRVMIVLD